MVEVFKTNVTDLSQARMILDRIHETFAGYHANFDLEDIDHILRVRSVSGIVESSRLIDFLGAYGFNAEVLPDDYFPVTGNVSTSKELFSGSK